MIRFPLKFSALAFCLLCLSSLSFAQTTPAEESWTTWNGSGAEIQFPAAWTLSEDYLEGTEFFVFVTGELKSNLEDNLSLAIRKLPGLQLKDFTSLTAEALEAESGIMNIKFISRELGSQNGLPYARMEYSGKSGRMNMTFHQRIFKMEDNFYILTFTTLKKNYPRLQPVIEKIYNTFRFVS